MVKVTRYPLRPTHGFPDVVELLVVLSVFEPNTIFKQIDVDGQTLVMATPFPVVPRQSTSGATEGVGVAGVQHRSQEPGEQPAEAKLLFE